MGRFAEWLRWRRQEKAEQMLHTMAIGVNSTAGYDDRHILMMDFDLVDEKRVLDSIQDVQQFWGLGPAFMYATKHGFHVLFFFDIMPYSRVKLILEYADGVDNMFRYISRYYNHKTLRVSGKHAGKDIVFMRVIPGVRYPSKFEVETGLLKYKEHCILSGNEVLFDEIDSIDERFVRQSG